MFNFHSSYMVAVYECFKPGHQVGDLGKRPPQRLMTVSLGEDWFLLTNDPVMDFLGCLHPLACPLSFENNQGVP